MREEKVTIFGMTIGTKLQWWRFMLHIFDIRNINTIININNIYLRGWNCLRYRFWQIRQMIRKLREMFTFYYLDDGPETLLILYRFPGVIW